MTIQWNTDISEAKDGELYMVTLQENDSDKRFVQLMRFAVYEEDLCLDGERECGWWIDGVEISNDDLDAEVIAFAPVPEFYNG